MADTWSVFITFEGPGAETQVRAMIDDARDDAGASFIAGGPDLPDWDFGAMGPGWEKHEYDLQRPKPASPPPVEASPDFATTYKEFRGEDVGECLRAATAWIEENYGDANPLAMTTHYVDDWTVGVVIERA